MSVNGNPVAKPLGSPPSSLDLWEYGQRPAELVSELARGCGVDGYGYRCGDESQPPPTRVEGGLWEVGIVCSL